MDISNVLGNATPVIVGLIAAVGGLGLIVTFTGKQIGKLIESKASKKALDKTIEVLEDFVAGLKQADHDGDKKIVHNDTIDLMKDITIKDLGK